MNTLIKLVLSLSLIIYSLSVSANIAWQQQIQQEATISDTLSGENFSLVSHAVTSLELESLLSGGFNYLNKQRAAAGLLLYSSNSLLDQSAYNHSNYHIINNASGHGEDSTLPGFTGASPTDRGGYAGYKSSVAENISSGSDDVFDSVDQLFSAIYHRFGFLDFSLDEIGLGASSSESYYYKNSFVYNMGVSEIENLCRGENFSGSGAYYFSVCVDSSFRIEKDSYESARDQSKSVNPSIVVWPYDNQPDSLPVFYEESPDPLPDCSVSGYPVSVQFNDYYSGTIAMQSFKLYDADENEIANTRILTKDTDPQQRFSAYEFALYPLDRLDWGSRYKAEFIYTEDGTQKVKSWWFSTKAADYPYYQVTINQQHLAVVSGNDYIIYLPPSSCNDIFTGYSASYSGIVIDSLDFNDLNSLAVRLTGNVGGYLTINFNNGMSVTLDIAETDSAIDNTPAVIESSGAVVDFGAQYGIWHYNNDSWSEVYDFSSEQLGMANLDAVNPDDIIIDFGSGYGLWAYNNQSDWTQLHDVSPEYFTVGDVDNNFQDDVIVDFGAQYGLWKWMNSSTWQQLHTVSAEDLITADMDNNPHDEIIIDFGTQYGLWIYQNNSDWKQLNTVSSVYLGKADMDGNAQDEVIIDFGAPYGIWVYQNNTTWVQLHTSSSNGLTGGDLDGNGQDDVIIDFGSSYGIWSYMNNSNWVRIHASSAEQMSIAYIDNNQQADLLIDFGSQYGLWVWKNNTTWQQLHTVSPVLLGD